jgi:hypothetical protein
MHIWVQMCFFLCHRVLDHVHCGIHHKMTSDISHAYYNTNVFFIVTQTQDPCSECQIWLCVYFVIRRNLW